VGDKALDFGEAVEAARRARYAVVAFEKVTAMQRPPREPAQSLSKGRTLPPVSLPWQEQVLASATPKQKPYVALLWATGCRPAEIEAGVTVRRVTGGIEVEIPGAKVTAENGQPRRRILIDGKSKAGLHLAMALGAKDEVTLSRKAKRIGHDFADIKRRTGLAAVSAYSFRHQVSADLKAAGTDPQAIAQVLGHASERTQGRYGKPSKGRAGGGIILDAIATREVRTGRPGPGSNQPSLDG
jgi:integrase